MKHDRNLIPITDDVCSISDRFKGINKDYSIAFNKRLQKFELHDEGRTHTYLMTFPYDELDSRAIDSYQRAVYNFNHKSVDQTMREIDYHNQKLDDKSEYEMLDRMARETRDYVRVMGDKE